MSVITKDSSAEDVCTFLRDHDLHEIEESFKGMLSSFWDSRLEHMAAQLIHFIFNLDNNVDGEDFHDLEMLDINNIIPTLKLRKRFVAAWSKETNFVSKETN